MTISQITPTHYQSIPETAGQKTMAGSLGVVFASDQTPIPMNLNGALVTLLASTTIIADAITNYAAVTGLDIYSRAAIALAISGKVMDAGTTLNIYVQRSLDGGASWDDIGSFSQLTSALIGNGTYYMEILLTGFSLADRVGVDGALVAHTVQTIASWGDRLRIKATSVNFAGADTVTLLLTAFMVP